MRLNLDGVYFLTKALQENITDGGRIVNIASQLGTAGRAAYGPYAASKTRPHRPGPVLGP